jgi:spermidine/putrescine transport system ATP-binding protein
MGRIQSGVEQTEVIAEERPPSVTSVVVDVQAVKKSFRNGPIAVDRVSITVPPGIFLCLLGPSGSGKTTLLRLIGGLEVADEGRVLIDGQDVTAIPAGQRRTNMVFQHHALFPHLDVHDNVAFGPRMRRATQEDIECRVTRALDLVHLAGYEARRITELSGGQRQRVAIARAIINDPAVLLLDEPLASLDMRLRGELQGELRRLQRSLGSTFISVTHDQDEAMALADQIAVINEGRIEQLGSPYDIYRQPASLFVAQFIGRTNVIRGVICGKVASGQYSVDLRGLIVPCHAIPSLFIGQPVSMVLRQESISVLKTDANSLDGNVRISGTVLDRVFLGARVRYTLRLTETLIVIADSALEPPHNCDAPSVGDKIIARWNLRDVPVFAAP